MAETGASIQKPVGAPAPGGAPAGTRGWVKASIKSIQPMEVLIVGVCCMLPNIVAVIVLSDVGFGLELYNAMSPTSMSQGGDAALAVAAFTVVCLYVLDWFYWESKLWRFVAGMVPVSLFVAGAFLKARRYPWAPLLFVLFLVPVALGFLRETRLKDTKRTDFYTCVSLGTFIAGLSAFAAWMAWMVSGDHWWNRETKDDLAARSGTIYQYVHPSMQLDYVTQCHPDLRDLTGYSQDDVESILGACAKGASIWFLVWLAPFVATVCDLVVSVFCFIHGVRLKEEGGPVVATLKQFMLGMVFLLVAMYGTVSFTNLALNATIMGFFAAALASLVVWSFVEIGSQNMREIASSSTYAKHLKAAWRSDWVRAIGVGAANVLILVFLLLNRMNKRVRRRTRRDTSASPYTEKVQPLVDELSTWNWVSILTKVAILAELFFTLQVGVSKVTYIFLSWLSRQLALVDFGLVCVLVFCIGNLMFLLPPVPGIPVYVFTGIVIADQGDRKLGPNGFIWGILIAVGIAFVNKLSACLGQYSIGYFFSRSVKIQQLIKVDSVPTRAIESIIKRRGLDPGKVAILIGGPDWPTSVGCGMVKVSIPQMLLGTSPVLFLLSPCVLAGAFIARQGAGGPDSIFPMLTNLSLVVSTVTQASAGLLAGAYILKEIEEQGEELAKWRQEHAAVAELSKKEQHANEKYQEVTQWSALGTFDKVLVISLATTLELSCFVFVMMAEACFRPFSVDKDINASWEEGGLNGDPTSIVLHPVGSGALCLFGVGVVLHILHSMVMGRRHRRALKAETASQV
mmetsp:Transcript_129286/g.374345  ORF Transcript_129286/g.374345 Transcript_129286/m.374345 type:complete len:797 (-) Transcript_129286:247-2637(-)|eukprot:CAMPEP_0176080486 /NCGR_PEP_ID=MMETSP0120_2-20121206/40258_1 /TAXON_ID=160619 /ORGANISM="Kryptoperidinium foliaceum, Strain CCMP 1326" /LENGTH=796 /DNA_ID=CAMNT_0017414249 /DNA_START=10 /DNA_END=2400 /DNA_ORIENTATION=-